MINPINLTNRPKLHAFLTLAFAVAATVFFMLWFLQVEELHAYQRANACWRVLRSMGPAFAHVTPAVTSHPRCDVLGWVQSEADLELLNKQLDEALMPDERSHVFLSVQIRPTTEPSTN